MLSYIKLIRPLNLFIIALTQYLIAYLVIRPMMMAKNYDLLTGHFDFALFVLAHVLIAAAGYIINDYYDIQADSVNKPAKNMLISTIKPQTGYNLHLVLNIIAGIISFYCAFKIGNIKLGFIPVMVSLALYFYALKYKRQLFVGNIVVAFVIAYSVLVVWLFQFFAIKNQPIVFTDLMVFFPTISYMVLGYGIFAFLTNLIREIIKDTEDIEGDKAMGVKSIPIKYGIKKTKLIIMAIIIITMLLLGFTQYMLIEDFENLAYYGVFLHVLFLYLIFKLTQASQPSDFRFISLLAKIIMIAGIISTQLIYIAIKQ